MSKPWDVIDLVYILECLATLTDTEFERAVKDGKVGFVSWLMGDLRPGQLVRLARECRAREKDDGQSETI